MSETVDGAALIHPTVDKPDFYRQGIHEQLQFAQSAGSRTSKPGWGHCAVSIQK